MFSNYCCLFLEGEEIVNEQRKRGGCGARQRLESKIRFCRQSSSKTRRELGSEGKGKRAKRG